jgi:hypothetical protein
MYLAGRSLSKSLVVDDQHINSSAKCESSCIRTLRLLVCHQGKTQQKRHHSVSFEGTCNGLTNLRIPNAIIRIVLSHDPEATRAPSGENARTDRVHVVFEGTCDSLASLCIPNANRNCPWAQKLLVCHPEENTTARTQSVWPRKIFVHADQFLATPQRIDIVLGKLGL